MIEYCTAVLVLESAFDIVRRGDDGGHLVESTLLLLGIREEES
jgi:hypothetical protein